MRAKNYFAICAVLLFVFSALPSVMAGQNGIISASQADLNGPRVNKVLFSVISNDAQLYSSLAAGTIQGPEWTLSTGSYTSALSDNNLAANSSLAGVLYGVGFNGLRPVTNTTAFHRAMAYLTDYSFIQSTVLSGVEGVATPDYLPCSVFPTACTNSLPTYPLSLTNAVKELKLSGLKEGNTTDVPLASITWLYNGQPFTPKFLYESDNPQLTGIATSLINNAKAIGLTFNAQGVSGSGDNTEVYAPSAAATIKVGVYNPATGLNSPPVFNYSAAATVDNWDLFTLGWYAGADYNWPFTMLNSQNVGVPNNFLDYYNQTMDEDTNALQYAPTIQAAEAAAQKVAVDGATELPFLMSYYQNTLWADYVNGWTGYVNVPSTGPNANAGIYWTLLNVHPTNDINGGTFNYGQYQAPIPDGLNPLYTLTDLSEVDITYEIYDMPLVAPPAQANVALAYMNWMTTSYSVAPFTGKTGTTAGWFQEQSSQTTANKIVSGDEVTLNFDKNITWSDNVPLTAADYNFSLYAFGLASPPSLPDDASSLSGTLSGPSGLIATYIPPSNPYQIQIYLNSSSVWNLPSLVVQVMPQHIFKYFNTDKITTAAGAIDTTMPYAQATASSECGSPCSYLGSTAAPTWLQYLPNLEIGSGPFTLAAYSDSTGAGQLDKNVNYFRSAWQETAPTVTAGTTYNFAEDINESIYNAGSSAMGGVSPGQTGMVPIANATGTVTVISPDNKTVATIPLASGTNGQYSVAISTTGWAPGTYELVTQASFNFLGLARTWYEANGITVSGSTAATTTSSAPSSTATSTAASPSSDYILVVAVVAVAAAVAVSAAVFARRRQVAKP